MIYSQRLIQLLAILALATGSSLVLADQHEGFDEYDGVEDELADYYGDEDFISLATGTKQLIHKAPSIASVITAEQIRTMGARNLTQVLDTVPGLHASRSGQLLAPEYWFRGITSTFNPQTLMMINGVSTKSVVRGDNHVVWGEFPIHAIDRIEIIRGPGSALYGADAFSGVINIITKKSSENAKSEIGVMNGSFATNNLWLNNQYKIGQWTLASNFEYLESDGYEGLIDADAQTNIDIFAATLGVPPASLAPGYLSNQFKSLDLWLAAENDWLSFDIGLLKRYDLGSRLGATEVLDNKGIDEGYKNLLSISVKEQPLNETLFYSVKLSFYGSSQEIKNDFLLFPEGAFLGSFPDGFIGNPGWEEETTKFELDFNYLGFEKSDVKMGIGYERQNLYRVVEQKNFFSDFSPRPEGVVDVSDTPEVFMPEADRESHFAYIQSVSQIAPDWELTAGARIDDYTDFGSTFNPRAALVWSTSLKLTTKFLYGKAFRAPAFAELLVVNNPIALGNPDLKPETIDTYELAFNYNFSPELSFDLNIYNYQIEDFITFTPDPNGITLTAQNVGERTGNGFEANVDYSLSRAFKLYANIAFVNAQDDLMNADAGNYPNFQSYIRAEWKLADNWSLNTQISSIGNRKRTTNDTRNDLGGYTMVNFNSKYQFSDTKTFMELVISNAFDEDIREPSSSNTTFGGINVPNDIPQEGRAIFLSLWTQY